MKRILSLLLALTLFFGLLPYAVHAETSDAATEPEANQKNVEFVEVSEAEYLASIAEVTAAPESEKVESVNFSKAEVAYNNSGIATLDVGEEAIELVQIDAAEYFAATGEHFELIEEEANAPAPIDYEPNNSFSYADRLYLNESGGHVGTLTSSDYDYYYFTLSSRTYVTILIVSSRSSTKFTVYNSSYSSLGTPSNYDITSGGYYSRGLVGYLNAGTYYVKVYNSSGYSDTYSVGVTTSGSSSSHTHSYTSSVIAPTCTSDGYTKMTCSCGDYYYTNTVSATGHSYGSYISDNNGTPNSDGTKTKTCSKCGDRVTVTDTGARLPDVQISSTQGHLTGNILRWNAVEGADLYQVFRLNNGSWDLLTNTRGTAYKDTTAPTGVKSYYKVRARNGNLMSSIAVASTVVTRPAPITSLANVTISKITAHTTGNIIYWNTVPNALLYQVYRLDGSSWKLLKNTSGTAYKDETAPIGVKVYYKIVARRDALASNIGSTTSASATRPAPITSLANVTISSINGHKTGNIISWKAVPNALLYQVYRLNGSSWKLLKNTSGTAYKDETAPCGVRSYYKIVARRDSLASNIGSTASSSAVRAHDYTVTDSATVSCTTNGYTTYTCNTCNHSYTNTVQAPGHNWQAATCTKSEECSRCGSTRGQALGHQGSGAICERCGGSTFESIRIVGYGDKLIQNVSLPEGNYLVTLDNYSTSRMVFVYLYNWSESSWEKSMSVDDYQYKEMVYTGSLNGYIEVSCGDSSSGWLLTIERLS